MYSQGKTTRSTRDHFGPLDVSHQKVVRSKNPKFSKVPQMHLGLTKPDPKVMTSGGTEMMDGHTIRLSHGSAEAAPAANLVVLGLAALAAVAFAL